MLEDVIRVIPAQHSRFRWKLTTFLGEALSFRVFAPPGDRHTRSEILERPPGPALTDGSTRRLSDRV